MSQSDSGSDVSTIPFAPRSFSEDVTDISQAGIFALLRPLNSHAREAYNATINVLAKDSIKFKHIRQFVSADSCRARRADSVFTEDGDLDDDDSRMLQWTGAFKFKLDILPYNPTQGWYIGTNRGRALEDRVDILLAPPSGKWTKFRIAGKHARLFIHKDSCRMVLEARHTVTIGRNGASVLNRSMNHVLEQGEMINIGSCVYAFEYASFFTTSGFEAELHQFMQKHHKPQ